MTYVAKKYLPKGIDKEPTTVVEALIAGRAVLQEENRWRQGDWFKNEHPDVNPDDPFCNSWQVCAEGAVALVTIGVFSKQTLEAAHMSPELRYNEDTHDWEKLPWQFDSCVLTGVESSFDIPEYDLYYEAIEQLRKTAERLQIERTGEDPEDVCFDYANEFNDYHISTAVEAVEWFTETIKDVENATTTVG